MAGNARARVVQALPFVAVLAVVVWVQGTYRPGRGSAWAATLRIGSAECLRDMGVADAVRGQPCPFIGAPRGFPFLLGGSEALVNAVIGLVTRLDVVAADVPIGLAASAAGLLGGYVLIRSVGAGRAPALLASALYAVSPFLLGVQWFLGTGTGMLLLPAYLAFDVVGLRWLAAQEGSLRTRANVARIGAYVVAAVVLRELALFLDGYTFVMWLLGSACFAAAFLLRRRDAARVVPAVAAALVVPVVIAWATYARWSRGSVSADPNLGVFRAWGADVITFVKPNSATAWAAAAGASEPGGPLWGHLTSTGFNYLGLVLGALAVGGLVVALRRPSRTVVGLAASGAVALVLALGPAVSIDARVPSDLPSGAESVQPIGEPRAFELPWAAVFEVPGISAMRYPYRWAALTRLTAVAFAAVAVTRLTSSERRASRVVGVAAVAALVLDGWPNVRYFEGRQSADVVIADLRDDLVPAIREVTAPGSLVVFVDGSTPGFANDYLANAMTTLAGLSSFNVGGDKNVDYAEVGWPASVRNLIVPENGMVDVADVVGALHDGADAIVFVDIDMVESVNAWPTPANRGAFEAALDAARADPALVVATAGAVTSVALGPEP